MPDGNVSARMVIDTGADVVVFTEKLARKLNQDITIDSAIVTLYANLGDISGLSFAISSIVPGDVSKEKVHSVIMRENRI